MGRIISTGRWPKWVSDLILRPHARYLLLYSSWFYHRRHWRKSNRTQYSHHSWQKWWLRCWWRLADLEHTPNANWPAHGRKRSHWVLFVIFTSDRLNRSAHWMTTTKWTLVFACTWTISSIRWCVSKPSLNRSIRLMWSGYHSPRQLRPLHTSIAGCATSQRIASTKLSEQVSFLAFVVRVMNSIRYD